MRVDETGPLLGGSVGSHNTFGLGLGLDLARLGEKRGMRCERAGVVSGWVGDESTASTRSRRGDFAGVISGSVCEEAATWGVPSLGGGLRALVGDGLMGEMARREDFAGVVSGCVCDESGAPGSRGDMPTLQLPGLTCGGSVQALEEGLSSENTLRGDLAGVISG
jgi:hypothetical protein